VADRSVQGIAFAAGQESRIGVSVPALPAFTGLFCPTATPGEAGLLGLTFLAGTPTRDLAVRVTWTARVGAQRFQVQSLQARSGPRGLYTFCSLPVGHALRVELVSGRTILATGVLELQVGEYRWLDLAGVPPG
jgi:hypothetical protein